MCTRVCGGGGGGREEGRKWLDGSAYYTAMSGNVWQCLAYCSLCNVMLHAINFNITYTIVYR